MTEMLCSCSKTYCCNNSVTNKTKFCSKGLNKSVLEENSDGPFAEIQTTPGRISEYNLY